MDFAIVGMDCILPGSPDADRWIRATEPAFREVPASRWPDSDQLAETAGTPDHTVSKVGGWLDDADGLIPWSQQVIGNVLDEAKAKPESTHLFLANLSLPSTAAVRQLAMDERPAFLDGDVQTHHSSAAALHAKSFFRLAQVSCLDAACASGLYAVRLAMDALRSGDCDTAIAAGVQACDPSYLLIGFSQLLALSPTGTPLPLDQNANGLVVGEGAAAVLLKRLPDAIAAGDTIHAVLKDGGLGNDGRKGNMLAPNQEGQLRAMTAAWEGASLDASGLGYVECHATGTDLGDSTELRSLIGLLEASSELKKPVAVSSAKALIGHTITVAGLAGLIRATGAVRDGFVPAGPQQPVDLIKQSPLLRVAKKRQNWPRGVPRRAAVSAFGFGGTNAHLIVEAFPKRRKKVQPKATPPAPQGRFGIRAGLRRLLDRDQGVQTAPEPEQLPAAPPPVQLIETPKVVVTGLAGQVGTRRHHDLFDALRRDLNLLDARRNAPIEAVLVDPRRWRIPPLELCDLQPQQLLAMEIGADALETAGITSKKVACIFGLELDPAVCEQVVRWSTRADSVPALNAQRVQGQLPNFVANRLSAQLGLEGPSYTVSAGPSTGSIALQQAARLLAQSDLDAVVVGAVDAAGPVQGAIAMVVQRDADSGIAWLDLHAQRGESGRASDEMGCVSDLLSLTRAVLRSDASIHTSSQNLAIGVEPMGRPIADLEARNRVLVVPNARGTDKASRFGPGAPTVQVDGDAVVQETPIFWSRPSMGGTPVERDIRDEWKDLKAPTPSTQSAPNTVRTGPAPAAVPPLPATYVPAPSAAPPPLVPAIDADWVMEVEAMDALTASLARNAAALTEAHATFLHSRRQAAAELAALGTALGSFDGSVPLQMRSVNLPSMPAPAPVQAPYVPPTSMEPPRSYNRAALERHASGDLSEVFGPSVKHLDRYSRRTRMPEPPLLLCSRVVTIEGEPHKLGSARIVTEYDLPTDENWSHHDGKPNACVIVESGQADLFLVSWLGVENHCKGERIYRLLDCDLTFHGPRPQVGETLNHDIRIKSFAKLGSKILFYFEYDCISNTDGRKVLTMRNGVAGFFTPGELAVPQGVDPVPPKLERMPAPVTPRFATSVTALDERGVQGLVSGRFSDAFGAAFAPADGSQLTLPNSEWRLVHRVEEVRTNGGPYGLGLARTAQVLRDDDWFNPCHFKGDPCMPGTLMLEGCLQAVQTWLLATGIAAGHPNGLFEPLPETAFELRCRGQVVPGHSLLVYEARIKEASLDGVPYAIADVMLSVDGTPVVIAKNVGVTIGVRAGTARSGASRGLGVGSPQSGELGTSLGADDLRSHVVAAERGLGSSARNEGVGPQGSGADDLRSHGMAAEGGLGVGSPQSGELGTSLGTDDLRSVPDLRAQRIGLATRFESDKSASVSLRDSLVSVDDDSVRSNVDQTAWRAKRAASAVVPTRQVYEYSIGDAERAFGPRYAEYAGISPRCARMPGPPLLQMTRAMKAEKQNELLKGESVTIDYDVPPDAWYFETMPGTSMPFAILLETALQPCGWLTAWQAAGLQPGKDLFFRNLGGKATQFVEVWPDSGTLTTTTKQTVVAQSAGLLIHNFALDVYNGDVHVYTCTTSFGYFSAAALDGQKGLPLKDEDRRASEASAATISPISLVGHPTMPRDDWRNLDRLIGAAPNGGANGLGFYKAEKDIVPTEWFFTAHFFLDPVMPGSLGLEASLQLARYVFEERTGKKARSTPIRLGVPHEWKYRGQIRRPVSKMTVELEVVSISDDEIVFDAVLRGDGTPIYEMKGFGITAAEIRPKPAPYALLEGPQTAALLDEFQVDGAQGVGRLRLDENRFPWLADHCPTVTAPALPMAFAAEIAAEAALQLRPGAVVTGVPSLQAENWIHTGKGPVDVLVVAVADGDHVAVTLSVHVENERFPKLSGPKVHMKAVVALGTMYPAAPAVDLSSPSPRVGMDVETYYGSGRTFHGPSLQGMIDLGQRGPTDAVSLFRTKPDAELNGATPAFVLDPLLLDTATHPMMSGEPEIWNADIGPGKLAYPVSAEAMTFYGPRPSGDVVCKLSLVEANAHVLTFDVLLAGADGLWCTFRWTEALVPGGPVLGRATPVRHAFVWGEAADASVVVGKAVDERWRVERADLVEPIEDTLVGLYCTDAELEQLAASEERLGWTLGRLAAKEAARVRMGQAGCDVHPKQLTMLDLRRDLTIVTNVAGVGMQTFIDVLGPTRVHLRVELGDGWAEAWFEGTGWPT